MPRVRFILQTAFSLPAYVKRKNRAWAQRAKQMLKQI